MSETPERTTVPTIKATEPAAAPNWAWFAAPLVIITTLDLLTKHWIFSPAEMGERGAFPVDAWLIALHDHWTSPWIEPHINKGVAWSLFADWPGAVAVVSLLLIPILFVVFLRWFRPLGWLENIAFGCVLGGALGNGWDRIWAFSSNSWGGVRDFIQVDLNLVGIDYIWPTFNIADVGISIGFIALLISSFRPQGEPRAAT